jgi:NAD(P)-dependent dehydrogenase (short-subunit alcohol dehydrogenase family)
MFAARGMIAVSTAPRCHQPELGGRREQAGARGVQARCDTNCTTEGVIVFSSVSRRQISVITGASAGVGRATAREFARRGWCIGLLARGEDGLEAARREVEALGGEALVVPADVANAEQVEAAAAAVEDRFGPIDLWVNNAMVSVFSPIKEMTPAEFKRVTEVTYLGVVHGTLAALRRMLPRDRGTILQVGSALAYRAIPLQSAYCAAKHAVQGFTEALRCELLHDRSNVRVTMVQLPALNTPQFGWVKTRLPGKPQPVPPIFQPEVAARAIVWAAHHDRRELNVGLPTSIAVIGNKIAPGLGDHYLARTGYDSQQTDEPVEPDRRDNLWAPVPGDHGAHGTFGDRASGTSAQLWATTHRAALATLCLGVAGAAYAIARR